MIRHVVVFEWKEDTSADQIDAVIRALAGLPAVIPQIVEYRFGTDLGLADGNAQFAVVADFDDQDGYEAYRDDPTHRSIIAEVIAPIISTRSAVQHEIPRRTPTQDPTT